MDKKILVIGVAAILVLLFAIGGASAWTRHFYPGHRHNFHSGFSFFFGPPIIWAPPAHHYYYPPPPVYYGPGYYDYRYRAWTPGYWDQRWEPNGWERVWVPGYWRYSP